MASQRPHGMRRLQWRYGTAVGFPDVPGDAGQGLDGSARPVVFRRHLRCYPHGRPGPLRVKGRASRAALSPSLLPPPKTRDRAASPPTADRHRSVRVALLTPARRSTGGPLRAVQFRSAR
jgi:hypothetical protein